VKSRRDRGYTCFYSRKGFPEAAIDSLANITVGLAQRRFTFTAPIFPSRGRGEKSEFLTGMTDVLTAALTRLPKGAEARQ
jgi:hypothetical protein